MGQEKREEEVIAEYLAGGVSLRELAGKHGMHSSTLHRWVKAHRRGERVGKRRGLMKEMPKGVDRLQEELYEAKLKNELLEEMIRIAEEEMGIPIRKKHGAKRRRK